MTKNQSFEVSLKTILKNNKDEILLLKNSKRSWMYGFYDFPGGRAQESETNLELHEIAKRELIEEVGNIDFTMNEKPVSYGRHHYHYPEDNKDIQVIWIFFESQYLGGQIKISDEHIGFDWVKLEDLDIDKSFPKNTGGYNGIKNYLKWTK